jgi:hypothetical protein
MKSRFDGRDRMDSRFGRNDRMNHANPSLEQIVEH